MASDDIVWMYDPSLVLAILGSVVYGIIFIAITWLTFFKYRAWYFTVVVIGAGIEVGAYILRAYSAKFQTQLTPFVLTLTWTVLAPIFIAAGNYLLISRLIRAVLPPSNHRVLKVPGRRLTPIFVASDIVAFLIQGSGSGVASSADWTGDTAKMGQDILIAGLVFQLVSFSVFLAVFGRFHFLANRFESQEVPKGWRKVVRAVYISSVCIVVRCIYRVCEFAEGMNGYAFNHEWLFWVFETLPMILAIGVFCISHPSRYLGSKGAARRDPKANENEMV